MRASSLGEGQAFVRGVIEWDFSLWGMDSAPQLSEAFTLGLGQMSGVLRLLVQCWGKERHYDLC